MKEQKLNGLWKMRECKTKETYQASIPGSVLSCLLDNKVIPDPYYRENEYEIRELFWKDFEFERNFNIDKNLLEEENLELVCLGLDTLGEIYINQQQIAKTDNMHRTWRFDVKDYLHEGENNIKIVFKSTLQHIKDYKAEENKKITFVSCGSIGGNELIRKAHSMFGWDWGAQLPDAGIFRDIYIEGYSRAKLDDVKINQIHRNNEVELSISAELKIIQKKTYTVEINLIDSNEDKIACEKIISDEENIEFKYTIKNPQIWWPNGFGEQPLYQVDVILCDKDEILDEKNYKIGLRTIEVSQKKDEWGSEFAFCVNGVKIFTKGANYIPEDCIYSRITKDRLEYLVKSSARANYNCLRVWGGGYYPSDEFYDLCDSYGILIWQDLMFACNVYDLTEQFAETIVEEVEDNVKRLRHHASLALWCGNNEIESGWAHWQGFQTQSKYLKADYIKQFEYLVPKAVKEADDSTFFWPSSPSSGGCFDDPDSENKGDIHYWAVWHGQLPFSDYRNHYFRFCSEFGFQSFPNLKTVKTYTEKEDRNIFSKVMESHQKNPAANGKILYYLSENFNYPKNFDSLLYVSQILQGIAIKTGVEHFRRNRGRCMGSLYWQINDNWPVASWSSIDYYGRWKALHYMAENFYAPTAGSLVRKDDTMSAYIQNESLYDINAKATISLKTMQLEVLDKKEYNINVKSLGATEIGVVDYSQKLQELQANKADVFVELMICYADGREQIEVETFLPYKYMQLPKANIETTVCEENDKYLISLKTDAFANYVELDFEDADAIFENNYFALSKKEGRTITLYKKDISNGNFKDAKDVELHLKIRSIRDSYTF